MWESGPTPSRRGRGGTAPVAWFACEDPEFLCRRDRVFVEIKNVLVSSSTKHLDDSTTHDQSR
jgi:hypothetical protein